MDDNKLTLVPGVIHIYCYILYLYYNYYDNSVVCLMPKWTIVFCYRY